MSQATESAVRGFTGEIAPVKVSMAYRLGLAVVAIFMLVLPLIYLALIAGVAYGLFYHATENAAIFQTSGSGKGKLFFYLSPLIVGGILLLFMVKPLFAKRPETPDPVSLDPDDEPVLFAFVARLCEIVGAPRPKRIDIDHQVNASASFRHGLWSLFGNDLVLTIGLPLVAGLNLRELTGVLAHEFGHFAQGGGMRLTYVIRSVNMWFSRVVYERDAWDQRLERWSKDTDFRLAAVLWVARGFVWLTRKILWALMMAGHAVSCYMMRQMEFDADRYEARVSGSDTFEATAVRLQELGVANQAAFQSLHGAWREGKLVDDLPGLIRTRFEAQPDDLREKILEHIGNAKTGALDTHPSDQERIASARRENAEGVFRLQEPARVLFSDFDAVCRRVTQAFYRHELGEDPPAERMIAVEQLLQVEDETHGSFEALSRFYQGALSIWLPHWPDRDAARDAPDAAAAVREARETMERLAPLMRDAVAEAGNAMDADLDAVAASHLLHSGFTLDSAQFQLRASSTAAADESRAECAARMQVARERISPFHEAASRRMSAALHALDDPAVAAGVEDAASLREEAGRLLDTLDDIRPVVERQGSTIGDRNALHLLLQNAENAKGGELLERAQGLQQRLCRHVAELRALHRSHPFEPGASVGEHLVPEAPAENDYGAALNAAQQGGDRLLSLYYRTLGKLAETSLRIETALGLPAPAPWREADEATSAASAASAVEGEASR